MRINTDKQHRDVHAATVEHDAALCIIAERVAEKVGVNLDRDGVTWRAGFSTRDTGIGFKTDVWVEIIDDHAQKPVAVD